MEGTRVFQDIQVRLFHTSVTATQSIFEYLRAQIPQYFNKEVFKPLYWELLVCEMIDPYRSRS